MVDGTPQPNRHRKLGGKKTPNKGGKHGPGGRPPGRGSGFFVFPWWIELPLFISLISFLLTTSQTAG